MKYSPFSTLPSSLIWLFFSQSKSFHNLETFPEAEKWWIKLRQYVAQKLILDAPASITRGEYQVMYLLY